MNTSMGGTPNTTNTANSSGLGKFRVSLSVILGRASAEFYKRSARERLLIVLAGVIGISLIGYQIYIPVSDVFAAQSAELVRVEQDAQQLPGQIDRYLRLKSKRDEIEEQYQGVEIKEGALSLLENLVRTKIGISSGFTIKEGTPKPIGGAYEQVPYAVKFTGQSLAHIIDLLKEIVHGEHPMLLSEIDIRKSQRADRLEIDISVSSIRKIQK